MKFFKILSLFAMPFVMAQQGTRFVYQATLTPDSTNVEKKTELAYLDTDGKKSVFYAENAMKRDSLMERMRTTQNFNREQMQSLRSNLQFTIEKDLTNQSLIYKSRIGRDNYSYSETPTFDWKILPETVKIGDYQTQKAETKFGGRTWYAWFTQEIPLQDGPYKFSGLPGLIVKVQDERGDYSFDLMQTKKIAEIYQPLNRGQVIALPKSKYVEMEKKMQKDPASFFSAQRSSGGGRGPAGGGGGNRPGMDPKQIQEFQKRMEAEIKSKNNPIELK
ncbi:GLPGLI family protein [Epilithonimonas hispanica]|uniref:GLPGLI family protein n=1 Tax=Epilithonimonas hispanica TaxID=358687 RepID=A0A3D9D1H2_9FLAO|nr:GLPGLI family protein [Epilithonimonas hispanica]REC71859.1 GLPGLI family protein [Epilithonimonas hispanica]